MQNSSLSQEEIANLSALRAKITAAQAKVESAQKSLELANLHFKYEILSLYRKYGLNDDDKISDDGKFLVAGEEQK